MELVKVNSHPLVYTYIIVVTTCKKTTKQQSQEREREREREFLEAFLFVERGVCVRVSVRAQENGFYMPLLDIFFNYITKIQP